MIRRILQRSASLLAAWCLAAVPAVADVSSSALEALDHKDYHVRDEATRQLLSDESLTLDQLETLYREAVSEEQRHRILAVARHHYLEAAAQRLETPPREFFVPRAATPSGAVGIPQDALPADQLPQLRQSAVRVAYTFPGFPAHAVLQRDDLILAVDGQALPAINDVGISFDNFLQMIKTRPAGEDVTLTIWRDGQRLEVPFTLANLDALSRMYARRVDRGPNQLDEQWLAQWQRVQAAHFPAPPQDEPLTVQLP